MSGVFPIFSNTLTLAGFGHAITSANRKHRVPLLAISDCYLLVTVAQGEIHITRTRNLLLDSSSIADLGSTFFELSDHRLRRSVTGPRFNYVACRARVCGS